MPAADRQDMWQNFFWACALGTVVRDMQGTIWQKRSTFGWITTGRMSEYSADSIEWPVDVLLGGIE